ncbi:MAG: phosphodiester glycosidase family protein [Anaerolineales bacterium]
MMVTLALMRTDTSGKTRGRRRNSTRWQALLGLALLVGMLLPQPAYADDWRPIAEGVDYQEFLLSGPVRVYVARMDRDNPHVTLETSLGKRQLDSGKDTVSGMVATYDGSLSSWEPELGATMDVVAAINGSFHDIESGVPYAGMVQGGSYIRKFDDLAGGSGFVWRQDRFAFVGGCVSHPEGEQLLTVLRTGASHPVANINGWTESNTITIFTPHYGRRTPEGAGLEIRVAMEGPLSILPKPGMATGVVTDFLDGGSNPIPFDEIILRPRGAAAKWLQDQLMVGDRIGISSAIRHYESNCQSQRDEGWAEAYASLSGSFEFLVDGEIRSFDHNAGATVADPRTAICFNDDYLYFVVADGRQEGLSRGLTIEHLGRFCRDRLEANWGINQDGGGSSALWVDGEIVNRPSDGTERPVANGLMMVQVRPKESSSTFAVGEQVRASRLIDLGMGPGNNFQTPWDIKEGETGTIVPEPNGLQGVWATDNYWWKVDFGDRTGWVMEASLTRADAPPPTPTPTASNTPSADDPKTMMGSPEWLMGRALRRLPPRPLWP